MGNFVFLYYICIVIIHFDYFSHHYPPKKKKSFIKKEFHRKSIYIHLHFLWKTKHLYMCEYVYYNMGYYGDTEHLFQICKNNLARVMINRASNPLFIQHKRNAAYFDLDLLLIEARQVFRDLKERNPESSDNQVMTKLKDWVTSQEKDFILQDNKAYTVFYEIGV